jgi:hypothetical protein
VAVLGILPDAWWGILEGWLASITQRCGAAGTTDWPSTFLHLTAESATIGLRDLEVLMTMHEKRREFGAAPMSQRLSNAS